MNIIDAINLWDQNWFLFLNGFHAPFFDGCMVAISEKLTWVPLYIAVLYIVIKHWKLDALWAILALILCIVIADQVSSSVIKHMVQRPRPTHADDLQGLVHIVNGYKGGKYGFVSSHAANAFGFALLSSQLFRQKAYTIAIFAWAILTAYSRIYLGVHYPLDILGGIIVGLSAAIFCFWMLRKYRPFVFQTKTNHRAFTSEKPKTFITLWVLGLSFTGIVVYSIFLF